MGRYNEVTRNSTQTSTFEGGIGYEKTVEDAWSNMLFSLMLSNDKFYESVDSQESRYIELTEKMINLKGAEFVAKAAVFSRNVLGLRNVSELTAGILNRYQFDRKRSFYASYFRRPDGIGEVFGVIDKLGDKRSHGLIRGAADYLSSLDAYQIGKYPMKDHKYTLHKIINLTHPKSDVIDKYQKGKLESPDTWEVAIHRSTDPEYRSRQWKRLVEDHRLGYLGLIRNLKYILACSFITKQWLDEYLVPQIVNEGAIRKSLVYPFRIYTAWKAVSSSCPISLEVALESAFELSVNNMPKLDGKSLIVLDVSGSMESPFNKGSYLTIKEVCAVYAAALYTANPHNVTFYKFGNFSKKYDLNVLSTSVFKLIKMLQTNDNLGYGTDFNAVLHDLDESYDRMLLFSDMQVMGTYSSCNQVFERYCDEYGKCKLYSFDLGNYASQVVSQDKNITYITSLSDVTFKAIEFIENEQRSLIDVIDEYVY